jgi:hypothetical protein
MVWIREKPLALAGNRTEPPQFTTFSPVTILIMLTQLPFLAISWFIQGKRRCRNCSQFTLILIPVLLHVISSLLPIPVYAGPG